MPERRIDRVPAWYPALLIGPGLLVAFLAITADFIGLGIPRSGFNLKQQTLLTLGLIAAGLGTLIHRKAACDHLRKQRQYWKTAAFCAFPLRPSIAFVAGSEPALKCPCPGCITCTIPK